MPLENDKWRVVRGDCLWNIAKSVYGNGARWTEIADANGISHSRTTIYPNQLLNIPGVTSGAPAPAPAPTPAPPPTYRPKIEWFSLVAGSQREMLAIWSYNANKFLIRWEQWDNAGHLIMLSESQTNSRQAIASGRDTPGWNIIRFSVRPLDDEGNYLPNTDWAYQEYDYRNNSPDLPPDPSININENNVLTVTLDNISENINADSIEIAVYQDDTIKYKTAKVAINQESRFAQYVTNVDPGHNYKVRCRAVRGSIYGGWTNFTSNEQARPAPPTEITTLRPQVISEQMSKQYGVFVEWTEAYTAKQYEVQWTTNPELFDVQGGAESQTTEEGSGPKLLIMNIGIGHTYYFRVRSINDKGTSIGWTPIRSTELGTRPSAPTTWSNVQSAVLGEDINLYWMHNSTDGSYETFARLHLTVIDSAHPELEPMEYTKVIENTRPEEEKGSNGVYTINTNDPEWSGLLNEGFIIKWKVQTCGVINEYSEWSTEREINVYAQPSLVLDILNKDDIPIEEITSFPFMITVLASPSTQIPISYYVEIIANDGYTTVDEVGDAKVINPGDKVYQKYYDPERNAWKFALEMSPSNIDLQSGVNYTVNVTVSMNSGLNATESKSFDVIFDESGYMPYGDVVIDKETLTATIHPYCMENYEENDEILQRLSENCKLAVYRREYDGTFTEIATQIDNSEDIYVVDPHPALDYARYRVVAKTDDTGTISFADLKSIKIKDPAIVIQWAEKWTNFDYDNSGENNIEVPWAGSMIKIPYNVDVTESRGTDVSLINYVGRKHPVSYYGTHIGETASWSCEIPKDDKELLYALRRLSRWDNDVYVREPSGVGYWANVKVNISQKHLDVTIPVSFNITRVEGGM